MKSEIIIFVNEDDAVTYKWKKNRHQLIENNIELIDIKKVDDLKTEEVLFSGNSRPNLNSLYIKHPFENHEYV